MDQVFDFWITTSCRLGLFGIVFAVLVRLMPCNPGMYWWRDVRGWITDAMYWFAVPLLVSNCRTLLLVGGVELLFGGGEPNLLPVRHWPLWLQCVVILMVQDVLLYGIHRLFHTRLGWRFHAVHHSPQVLDWLSAGRFHPVNHILAFTLSDVAMLLVGFAPAALVVLTPFNVFYSSLVHANLKWTFGPLRHVLASPVFHRWHHTTEAEGLDKNFASTFPVLDVIFGTFYMPAGKLPREFGCGDPAFPDDLLGQLLYPFWLGRHERATAAPAYDARPSEKQDAAACSS